jgi:hypothetical protein
MTLCFLNGFFFFFKVSDIESHLKHVILEGVINSVKSNITLSNYNTLALEPCSFLR